MTFGHICEGWFNFCIMIVLVKCQLKVNYCIGQVTCNINYKRQGVLDEKEIKKKLNLSFESIIYIIVTCD